MPKIFLNSGHHPGIDSGAVSPRTGLQEADVTLDVGQKVKGYLEAVGYDVYLVQNDSLGYVCSEANDWGADYFVSIHCNSAENQSAKGCETWMYSGSVQGRKLADSIQNEIVKSLPIIDRGIKTSNGLYVLRNTDCPAVLVELAFISNEYDEELLTSEEYKVEFARAIARGISNMY